MSIISVPNQLWRNRVKHVKSGQPAAMAYYSRPTRILNWRFIENNWALRTRTAASVGRNSKEQMETDHRMDLSRRGLDPRAAQRSRASASASEGRDRKPSGEDETQGLADTSMEPSEAGDGTLERGRRVPTLRETNPRWVKGDPLYSCEARVLAQATEKEEEETIGSSIGFGGGTVPRHSRKASG